MANLAVVVVEDGKASGDGTASRMMEEAGWGRGIGVAAMVVVVVAVLVAVALPKLERTTELAEKHGVEKEEKMEGETRVILTTVGGNAGDGGRGRERKPAWEAR